MRCPRCQYENPPQSTAFLAERGLVLDDDVGASDYRGRYFGRSATARR